MLSTRSPDLVPERVVVLLEAVVIDQFDAEAIATVLVLECREQALFAHFSSVEERSAVPTHPAEKRLALLQLHTLLAKLLEHVQEHLVPVLDLVADSQVERVEPWPNQLELSRRELQHAPNVVEEVLDRAGELRLVGYDLCR